MVVTWLLAEPCPLRLLTYTMHPINASTPAPPAAPTAMMIVPPPDDPVAPASFSGCDEAVSLFGTWEGFPSGTGPGLPGGVAARTRSGRSLHTPSLRKYPSAHSPQAAPKVPAKHSHVPVDGMHLPTPQHGMELSPWLGHCLRSGQSSGHVSPLSPDSHTWLSQTGARATSSNSSSAIPNVGSPLPATAAASWLCTSLIVVRGAEAAFFSSWEGGCTWNDTLTGSAKRCLRRLHSASALVSRATAVPTEMRVTFTPSASAMAASNEALNSAEHMSSAPASTCTDAVMAQVELSPSHTPHSSKALLAQHTPPESSTPAQHAPITSTTLASPPHTPHASTCELGQHTPEASSAEPARQHSPRMSQLPMQQTLAGPREPPSHATASSHSAPLYPSSHAHACMSASHVPLPEHVSRPALQKSHAVVLHGAEVGGLGHSSHSASSAGSLVLVATQVRVRSMTPPSQSAEQALHSEVVQRTAGAQGEGAQVCSAAGGASSGSAASHSRACTSTPLLTFQQEIWRCCTPPPHATLQGPHACAPHRNSPQGAVLQLFCRGAVSSSGQLSTATGAKSASPYTL
mmetsp:Transcript_27593/g.60286  ORF Transcript_27593/g.60286 Transcript_27593/m.60286 type:complete len:574 (-) Transcript_27593:22-1743(-)